MQIPTHLLAGWCAANCVRLNARQRLACMIASAIPDLDGVTLIAGREAYLRTHHVLGHNVSFAILSSLLLCAWTAWRFRLFLLYAFCFHLHLVMDYLGSGRGWPIYYAWPFSRWRIVNPHAWDLSSWQNYVAMGLFFLWAVGIAIVRKRTLIEYIVPELDHRLFSLRANSVVATERIR